MQNKKTAKVKVPTASKVKVIKLKCPNCGEVEEKVILCDHCDSPMEVVEAIEMDREAVENDITIDTVDEDGSATGEDDDVDEEVLTGGLTDIFPGGDSDDMDSEDSSSEDGLSDIVDLLDQEE